MRGAHPMSWADLLQICYFFPSFIVKLWVAVNLFFSFLVLFLPYFFLFFLCFYKSQSLNFAHQLKCAAYASMSSLKIGHIREATRVPKASSHRNSGECRGPSPELTVGFLYGADAQTLILRPQPKGPFRTKNSTAPESVVFCYRRSFLLSVPFPCFFFWEKTSISEHSPYTVLLPP